MAPGRAFFQRFYRDDDQHGGGVNSRLRFDDWRDSNYRSLWLWFWRWLEYRSLSNQFRLGNHFNRNRLDQRPHRNDRWRNWLKVRHQRNRLLGHRQHQIADRRCSFSHGRWRKRLTFRFRRSLDNRLRRNHRRRFKQHRLRLGQRRRRNRSSLLDGCNRLCNLGFRGLRLFGDSLLWFLAEPAEQAFFLTSLGRRFLVVVGTKHGGRLSQVAMSH